MSPATPPQTMRPFEMGHPGIAGWNEFRVFGYGVDFGQGDVVAEAVEQEVGEGWVGGGGLELVFGG